MTKVETDNITQQPFDQFSKQFFNELFKPLTGEVKINYEVHAERRYVDVYWLPSRTAPKQDFQALGLLGRMVSSACLLEPFRSPLQKDDIKNCLLKLFMVHSVEDKADKAQQKAEKQKKKAEKSTKSLTQLPYLWIFATSVSDAVLKSCCAKSNLSDWGEGVYGLPEIFQTGIVAIVRLPNTPDTLYLRMLGKGEVQQQAIKEFLALFPDTEPQRQSVLELLFKYRIYLDEKEKQTELTEDEKELLMNLSFVYQKWEEETLQRGLQQGIQQGRQEGLFEGQRVFAQDLLICRFGKIDDALAQVIDPLLQLPRKESTQLLLQSSREELLAKFTH